jgi:hypothetical protein
MASSTCVKNVYLVRAAVSYTVQHVSSKCSNLHCGSRRVTLRLLRIVRRAFLVADSQGLACGSRRISAAASGNHAMPMWHVDACSAIGAATCAEFDNSVQTTYRLVSALWHVEGMDPRSFSPRAPVLLRAMVGRREDLISKFRGVLL